ncbi:hypothetical protein DSM03_104144 [Leeuwenhoekiella aestuarii]|uniref:hypothetical protein n=1 Tax=Leeuwenhoekiella aestuarii TaxID=2249426 RepID=UPI000FFE990E|nr:hypothetical protein [Leeuwenhoekiella aestuarii]RXG14986.1 hypothetical protein DSM03_104144 [Leeuwenhoekiella aestuarii]
MDVLLILGIALLSTVLMTAFSCILSKILAQNLIEPYWLNVLLFKKRGWRNPLGWVTHYLTGIGFMYLLIFLNDLYPLSLIATILVYGFLEGVLGIVMWGILFKMTHYPHKLNVSWYYVNLIAAHIVFATAALCTY